MTEQSITGVDAGFAGTVVAHKLADAGCLVCIDECRPDIAGNAFDEADAACVIIQCYEPHVFYRNSERPFASLAEARAWVERLVAWYNLEHRHGGIRFVTPQQRHAGEDHALLAHRRAVYEAARARQPARWRRHTRDWTPVGSGWLNPPRRRDDPPHTASAHVAT